MIVEGYRKFYYFDGLLIIANDDLGLGDLVYLRNQTYTISILIGCNVRLNGLSTKPSISNVTIPSRAWSSASPKTTGV